MFLLISIKINIFWHICMQVCSWNVKSSYFSPLMCINHKHGENSSRDTVGDVILSTSFKYIFCLLQFAQVLPLIIIFIFSFMRFAVSSAVRVSWGGSICTMKFLYKTSELSLYILNIAFIIIYFLHT